MESKVAGQNSLVNWADQGFCEYLLVALPDEAVNRKVLEEKQRFADEFHHRSAIKTVPYINIASFLAREHMEGTLIRWMQRLFTEQRSFTASLNNYSGLPEHSIFLRVQDQEPFRKLARQLMAIENFIRDNACPPIKMGGSFHLSIARELPGPLYEKAIMEYSAKTFHESFSVNQVLLIRRRHQFDSYGQIAVFGLLPENKLFS